ncbi:MAG: protein kinase [Gemmatimonas sp.]|nr:protein kinase [Gemmatimonas sp.]
MQATLARLSAALADRYRVDRELGAGGMATVYLAHDLRHERDVAIKVLHPDLGAALGAERFLSEIKTTAKLQHPHILPLLDSGAADGLLYYVMPYVRGETLRARLERERQLAIDDAVQIAAEVGDALAAAHALGIIHRDIKPENILLQDGHALVADFGIALAVQTAGGQRMTQTGLSLGTPQYMSPEQAVGEKSVDARSDLYALAAVTYEMLTGDPPFQGNNVQAIIARIISSEPEPVETLRKATPVGVSAAVMKSLAKLPADRHADVRQFVAALRGDAASGRSSGARVAPARSASTRRWMATGLLALLAAAGWWPRPAAPSATAPVALSIELPEGVSADNFGRPITISADGKLVVVAGAANDGSRQLYRRRLGEAGATPIPGTDDATFPVLSPDGTWVAFVSRGRLMKAPLDGGAVRTLADVGACYGLTWLSANDLVVSSGGRLAKVSAEGGRMISLPSVGTGNRQTERFPIALPDGRSLLYVEWVGGIQSARVRVRQVDGTTAKPFGLDSIVPLAVVEGGIIAALPGARVGFVPTNPERSASTGLPQALVTGVSTWIDVSHAAAAMCGALVYQLGSELADLVLYDPATRSGTAVSDERRVYQAPRFSPDGRRVAVGIRGTAQIDIWIADLASHTTARLTKSGRAGRSEWMPDGLRVLYEDREDTRSIILRQRWDGSDAPTVVYGGPQTSAREVVVSPDGSLFAYRTGSGNSAEILWRRFEGDTTSRPFASSPGADLSPRFSPDGKRLAWDSDVSGTAQVYVAAFPSGEGRLQVSDNGGEQALWSRDGQAIYFVTNRGRMLVRATIDFAGDPRVVKRDTLVNGGFELTYQDGHPTYDVAADGRLLMPRREPPGRFPVMVLDWRATRARGQDNTP